MSVFERVALSHFDHDGDGRLSSDELIEMKRFVSIAESDDEQFFELSDHEIVVADELNTAKLLDSNLETLEEFRLRARRRLGLE